MTQPLGPVMLDLEGQTLTKEDQRLLKNPAVGGVILFARNVESATQVRELCDSIRRVRGDLLLAVDQEGGRVQRIRNTSTTFLTIGSGAGVDSMDEGWTRLSIAPKTGFR